MPHLTSTRQDPPPEIAAWLTYAEEEQAYYNIGQAHATDLPYPELGARLARVTLASTGDPWVTYAGNNSNVFERCAVNFIGDLIDAPATRWGFVTTGSAAAVEHAITSAAYLFGDQLICYASSSAHRCVTEICARYRIPLITIRAKPRGAIDILDLRHQLDVHRQRPAIIIATLGTTWGEAHDDLAAINRVTDELCLPRVHLHADAALSGIPLALLPDGQRPACTFTDAPALTSWSTSGHTFLGVKQPCAAIVYRRRPHRPSITGAGSRNGAVAIQLWHQLTRIPLDEHRKRAQFCHDLAADIVGQLSKADWPSWASLHGFSVVLARPHDVVLERWHLSHQGQWSQIRVMPGMDKPQLDHAIDQFLLARAINNDTAIRAELRIPAGIAPAIAAILASL